MNKLLFLALTAPATLIFANVAVKFGVADALHALPCVLSSGAQLSAAPVALVGAALLTRTFGAQRQRDSLSPA